MGTDLALLESMGIDTTDRAAAAPVPRDEEYVLLALRAAEETLSEAVDVALGGKLVRNLTGMSKTIGLFDATKATVRAVSEMLLFSLRALGLALLRQHARTETPKAIASKHALRLYDVGIALKAAEPSDDTFERVIMRMRDDKTFPSWGAFAATMRELVDPVQYATSERMRERDSKVWRLTTAALDFESGAKVALGRCERYANAIDDLIRASVVAKHPNLHDPRAIIKAASEAVKVVSQAVDTRAGLRSTIESIGTLTPHVAEVAALLGELNGDGEYDIVEDRIRETLAVVRKLEKSLEALLER